jgi:Fur family ferric uptake transcriptional regulator
MTSSRATPPLAFASLEAACSELRNRGMRLSSARRLVLEMLFRVAHPLTADEIADGLDGQVPESDRASVYRNLEVFEELGVVRHVHLGHRAGVYTLTGRQQQEYLVCERCGAAKAVSSARIDPARDHIRAEFGFEARFDHFPISGLCAECAAGATPDMAIAGAVR